jgi:hypothetical protein
MEPAPLRPVIAVLLLLMPFAPSFATPRPTSPSGSGAESKITALEEAARLLGRQTGRPVRPYSTRDFGRDRFAGARSVVVPEGKAEGALAAIRERLGKGLVAFIGTTHSLAARADAGSEIVVGPGRSQFDIVRIAASDAVNYDMVTEDLIKRLEAWDKAYGIDIFRAESDTIDLRLLTLPKDLRKFVEEVYDFCPDIVDQGTGTVEALKEDVEKTRTVFLWWD